MKNLGICKTLLAAAFVASISLLGQSSTALAAHGQDGTVDAILGDGNGVFMGNHTHPGTTSGVHPWYTLDLGVGDTVNINLMSTGWSSYIWLYEVLNEPLQAGDVFGPDYSLVANGGSGTNNNLSYMATAATAGQFAIQVDSWIGGSGDYKLTVDGAIPEPGTLAIMAVGLAGLGFARRKKKAAS